MQRGPYKHLPKMATAMVLLALSVWSLSAHFGKIHDVTKNATGHDAIKLLAGQAPEVRGGLNGDPSRQAVEQVRLMTGGRPAGDKAALTLFPGDTAMTPEQRAKMMAEAERLRPRVPPTRTTDARRER
jgi:hypothetical protein